jgi:MarR family transcriptional regulator, transcriptional regulator for hemolysin
LPSAAKTASKAGARRRARVKTAASLAWVAGVSADGELLLRRGESHDVATANPLYAPFARGLTFVARRWRNLMNQELQAVGQSHARWGTLYWIAVFGDRVNQTQLAEQMGIEQPTLGRVLHKLEADGLIRRRAPRGDRRARVIVLTAASRPLMQRINGIQNEVRARLLKDIDPAELAACLAVFAKILDNMDDRPPARR